MPNTLLTNANLLSSGKQLILHWNPSAIAWDFSPHMAVLRRHFLPNMQFECCIILQGTLGGDFDIFAASGGSIAWVLVWKTRSRPTDVRVCPVAQFNFFNTSFDPRAWTMVVFWKETLGHQPQIVTPENEGGDETNYPFPPTFTFFDNPDVPFGPRGPERLPGHKDPPPAGGRERVEPRSPSRERVPWELHNPSLNWFRFSWVMTMMISHHRKRGDGDGRDRASEHILTHKLHRYHKVNQQIIQKLMRYQMKNSEIWIIHHHRLNHSHQLNKEVAQAWMKDRDHVSEHLHVHLRRVEMKVQQPWIHRIAWATVQGHIKNEKTHEEVVHNNSDRITAKRKENCCWKTIEWITKG